jgi:hypothetical protein
MLNFLTEPYRNIFNKLYELTDGKIILGGSSSLKYQNVISREVKDVDVNILHTDWEIYEPKLIKEFKFYVIKKIINPTLGFNFYNYTVLSKSVNYRFDLFVNFKNDFFTTIDGIRCVKPEFMYIDKQWILETEPELIKHKEDILAIKRWLNEK